jgi:predicted Fe-Mo cluster-binding NifX family protein
MAQTITAGSTMPATMINAGVTIVISQQVGGAANAVLLIADV